jgi:hypothetical protein
MDIFLKRGKDNILWNAGKMQCKLAGPNNGRFASSRSGQFLIPEAAINKILNSVKRSGMQPGNAFYLLEIRAKHIREAGFRVLLYR